MRVQRVLQSFLVLSMLLSSVVFAQEGRPGRYPGPGGGRDGGGNRPPGPVRPNPDNCYDRRDPRCNDGRDNRRDDGRHGGGRWDDGRDDRYHPPYRPQPRPMPPRHEPPYQPPYQPPYNPPYTPPPAVNNESSIVLNAVTRRAGGEWHRITLNYPIRVDSIQVQVLSAAVQIHEAVVTTRSGARYQVREFTGTGTFTSARGSEILNIYEDIVAIDLRAESMGGNADLLVTLYSQDGSTSLSSTRY